jgi:hypothetical protein
MARETSLSYTSAVSLGKRMSDQTNALTLSRRHFGVMVAAGAAATAFVAQEVQEPNAASTRLAPGSFQRPLVRDTPAFDGPLEFTLRDIAPRAHGVASPRPGLVGIGANCEVEQESAGCIGSAWLVPDSQASVEDRR